MSNYPPYDCAQNRNCDTCRVRSVVQTQENIRSGSCGCSRTVCGICSLKAAALFGILLALAVGLIFGIIYAETLFPALAAIIVFAVVMAVAVIALLIHRWCEW